MLCQSMNQSFQVKSKLHGVQRVKFLVLIHQVDIQQIREANRFNSVADSVHVFSTASHFDWQITWKLHWKRCLWLILTQPATIAHNSLLRLFFTCPPLYFVAQFPFVNVIFYPRLTQHKKNELFCGIQLLVERHMLLYNLHESVWVQGSPA